MITEKQSIIDEILYGDTFNNIDPPENGTNRTGSDNGKTNNCNLFNELCQTKLKNEYSGEQIAEIFSFIGKIDQSFCLNKLVNVKKFLFDFLSGFGRDKLIEKHYLVDNYKITRLVKILGIKKQLTMTRNFYLSKKVQIHLKLK